MSVGYSGTPLIKKLGIKPGYTVLFVNEPEDYPDLLESLPEEIERVDFNYPNSIDFINLFQKTSRDCTFFFLPVRKSWIKTL